MADQYPGPIVSMAAVKEADGKVYAEAPPARHHDVVHARYKKGHAQGEHDIQGFVLSDGTFVDRAAARKVAEVSGQALRFGKFHCPTELFSEDLW